jgi:hypothetical protein
VLSTFFDRIPVALPHWENGVKVTVVGLQVSVGLRIEKLEVLGNYTMSSWFSRSSGPFNVTLSNVYIEGFAKLEVERGGQLQAQNIDMDIIFQDIAMNFENLGFLGSIFQVCTIVARCRKCYIFYDLNEIFRLNHRLCLP